MHPNMLSYISNHCKHKVLSLQYEYKQDHYEVMDVTLYLSSISKKRKDKRINLKEHCG